MVLIDNVHPNELLRNELENQIIEINKWSI